MTSCSTVEF